VYHAKAKPRKIIEKVNLLAVYKEEKNIMYTTARVLSYKDRTMVSGLNPSDLIKIQLFIILSLYYLMKIWQWPVRCHVQMTFIVNKSNISLPDSESGKLSNVLVWSILIGWWNSLRWKLQRSSVHDLLWAAVRSSYDSIMKNCILIRLKSFSTKIFFLLWNIVYIRLWYINF